MSIKVVQALSPVHIVSRTTNNFTTFQSISPTPDLLIPQQTLEQGLEVELYAAGNFSNTGTPTLQLGFWFNTAATVLAANALTTTVTTAVSWPWQAWYKGRLTVTTPGTAATWLGQGEVKVGGSLTAWQSGFPAPIPVTAAARTVTTDTTAARAIGVGAAWGTASSSNTITVDEFSCLLITGL